MPINDDIILQYKGDTEIFFETGTLYGDGVNRALWNGFNRVYSVEMGEKLFLDNEKKYKNTHNVVLYKGDSATVLCLIARDDKNHPLNNEKCFIYLDAHGAYDNCPNSSPILEELDCLAKFSRRDHTILIDDFRMMRDPNGWEQQFKDLDMKQEIEIRAKRINKDYTIQYLDDDLDKEDVVVIFV